MSTTRREVIEIAVDGAVRYARCRQQVLDTRATAQRIQEQFQGSEADIQETALQLIEGGLRHGTCMVMSSRASRYTWPPSAKLN